MNEKQQIITSKDERFVVLVNGLFNFSDPYNIVKFGNLRAYDSHFPAANCKFQGRLCIAYCFCFFLYLRIYVGVQC